MAGYMYVAKPLPESVLDDYQLNPWEQTAMEFN